jgi:regulatory protein
MNKKEALSKVRSICARQEQCRKDILLKLSKWDISESDSEQILDSLEQEGFIDHLRYSKSFTVDKFKFDRWGRIKIRWMLKQKGISEDAIEIALSQIGEDEYENLLRSELQKKIKTLKSKSEVEKKAKLIQFATQRGFEYEIIYKVVKKLSKE